MEISSLNFINYEPEGLKDDLECHVFYQPLKNPPPKFDLDYKLQFEVFRKGNYCIIEMPKRADFFQREGVLRRLSIYLY